MMTDKDFDSLIKDALISEDVPPKLNEEVLLAVKKKKVQRAKIIQFSRVCSSCAAVFICAVAVFSYFNTDRFSNTEIASDSTSPIVKTIEKESAPKAIQQAAPPATFAPSAENKNRAASEKVAAGNSATENAADSTETVPMAVNESADSVTAEEESVSADASPKAKMAMPTLGELFIEGYDYTTIINERITEQINALPYKDVITFMGITGEENHSVNEQNLLTIEFPVGAIAPQEYGEQYFTVGVIENGILK